MLPGQYEHVVTERGGNLSGGQRQRIALARVFLQNPHILILDEATAALDNENEQAVMDAVSKVSKAEPQITFELKALVPPKGSMPTRMPMCWTKLDGP